MYGKMQESGLTEIIPFISLSALWRYYLASFHIPLSSVLKQRVPGARWLRVSRHCFSWVFSGLRNSYLEGWNSWWLWHPCLLIRQEILHSALGVSYKIWNCDKLKSILFLLYFLFSKIYFFQDCFVCSCCSEKENKKSEVFLFFSP